MLKVGDKVRLLVDYHKYFKAGDECVIDAILEEWEAYGCRKLGTNGRFDNKIIILFQDVELIDNVKELDKMSIYECIAYKLGLEMEEEFNIDGYGLTFKISNNGMQSRYRYSNEFTYSMMIGLILNEPDRIIKLPWKPKVNESYYYIDELLQIQFTHNEDHSLDYDFFKIGNVFKTRKDAENMVAEIKELFNS